MEWAWEEEGVGRRQDPILELLDYPRASILARFDGLRLITWAVVQLYVHYAAEEQ
jgi:hypothetical protein